MRGVALRELQFDEIKFAKVDDQPNVWIYTGMEVWSRLWLTNLTGTRTYWNTYYVVADAVSRGALQGRPFVTTDAMEYYRWAIERALHGLATHAVVEKRLKNGRLTMVERRLESGQPSQLEEALVASEDSDTVSTSFIERLNLTLRKSCSYLRRRGTSHPRCLRRLSERLELVRAWYNFCRPYRGLQFGRTRRTPAQQAGLVHRPYRMLEILQAPLLQGRPASATIRSRRGRATLHPWQLAA